MAAPSGLHQCNVSGERNVRPSTAAISWSGGRRCGAAGAVAGGARAGVSVAADPAAGRVRARRRHRRCGAYHGAAAVRAAGPADHHREPAGAGNNIGTETWCARPTATRCWLVNRANAINATLYKKLSFNFLKDIAPVAGFIRVPNVMEVNPGVPAKTVAEFIAYAKANPGKVN